MAASLLVFTPHPDDETYSFGGTLALAARCGAHIKLICASRGERGERHDGVPADVTTLGAAREAELRAACELLGVADVEVWGLPDGDLAGNQDFGTSMVAEAIDAARPDAVMTLGADGAYGHPDHVAVHRWVSAALQRRPGVAGLYASFRPGQLQPQYERCLVSGVLGEPPGLALADLGDVLADYEVGIGHVRATKLAAIAAHRSQLPDGDPHTLFPADAVSELLNVERFMDADDGPTPAVAGLIAGFSC
jgi:N-acetyl-1-D-myo-inositol-2-amino-2-deoxy-alpha-D-glucopyranoside deacetylase